MFRVILLCLLPLQALAGNVYLPDSLITLDEVQVSASRYQLFDAGYQLMQIQDHAISGHQHQSIDQLLRRHSGIFIKSYGPGILATTSLRGGSAAQTALVWNGFHIQNPMHGQTDLALIPVFFTDRISVQYGGGSAIWGSGSMGGVVHFQNDRFSEQGVQTTFGLSGSDTGELLQQLSLGAGFGRISTRIRLFNLRADNRYQYINTGFAHQPVMTQEFAGARQQGILHEIYYQPHPKHHVDIRWWLQDNARHIPPGLMQMHQGGFQEDASLRLTGQWSYAGKNGIVNWRGAFFDEQLLYIDSLSHKSNSSAETLSQEADFIFGLASGLVGSAGFHTQRVRAWSDEYADRKQQLTHALFASLKWDLVANTIQLHANARQEFLSGHDVPFAPSLGVSWRVKSGMYVKANAGKSYRIPSLNDRYWVPGGNPDLRPERGWSQDMGINLERSDPKRPGAFERFSLTGFHRMINDWIIWVPVQGSMHWRPENIMQVKSYGAETRMQGQLQRGETIFNWEVLWDYTRTVNTVAKSPNDASKGKQLIYVPQNQLGINMHVTHRQWQLSMNQSYTGKRYTTTDNSQWLEAYHHTDITLYWKPTSYQLTVFTSINNVFNESYQIMSGRPMPLRHFRAGVRYSVNLYTQNKSDGL